MTPPAQPHSLIVCDSLIVCAPAFSSPVGVEPLQRRYKLLQGRYRAVTSRYESLHSRYGAVTDLTSRYGVGRLLKSLCLTAAFSPFPAFLGGSCPSGCSLSAPATGGLSMVSPQYIRYAAGSEKEKRAWGPLHWGYYSTPVRILQWGGGITWTEGLVVACAAPSAEGLFWPVPLSRPLHPPTFLETGGLAVPPAGAAPPAPRSAGRKPHTGQCRRICRCTILY